MTKDTTLLERLCEIDGSLGPIFKGIKVEKGLTGDLSPSGAIDVVMQNGMEAGVALSLFKDFSPHKDLYEEIKRYNSVPEVARKAVYETLMEEMGNNWSAVNGVQAVMDVAQALASEGLFNLVKKYESDPERLKPLVEDVVYAARFGEGKYSRSERVEGMAGLALAYDDNPLAQAIALKKAMDNFSPWPDMVVAACKALQEDAVKEMAGMLSEYDENALSLALGTIASAPYYEGRATAIATAITKSFDETRQEVYTEGIGQAEQTIVHMGAAKDKAIRTGGYSIDEANPRVDHETVRRICEVVKEEFEYKPLTNSRAQIVTPLSGNP